MTYRLHICAPLTSHYCNYQYELLNEGQLGYFTKPAKCALVFMAWERLAGVFASSKKKSGAYVYFPKNITPTNRVQSNCLSSLNHFQATTNKVSKSFLLFVNFSNKKLSPFFWVMGRFSNPGFLSLRLDSLPWVHHGGHLWCKPLVSLCLSLSLSCSWGSLRLVLFKILGCVFEFYWGMKWVLDVSWVSQLGEEKGWVFDGLLSRDLDLKSGALLSICWLLLVWFFVCLLFGMDLFFYG